MNNDEAKEFVKIWQTSNSVKEVAEKLGISEPTAWSRGNKLRKAGVPLKKFSRASTLDIDELKRLAESLRPRPATGEPTEGGDE